MSCEVTAELASGNVFIRPVTLAPRDVTHGHRHNFDHTTIVLKGSATVTRVRDGRAPESVRLTAPAHLLIEAGVGHEIAAGDGGCTYWCVYDHRTPQGEVVQVSTGWEGAYR